MRRFAAWLCVVVGLLAGCATVADIKPGVVCGLDGRYVKTSEGFGIVTRECHIVAPGDLQEAARKLAGTFSGTLIPGAVDSSLQASDIPTIGE